MSEKSALLGTGSQNSYLSSRDIKDLNLKPKDKIKLIHGLFWERVTKHCSFDAFVVKICNLKDIFSFPIKVFFENKILVSYQKYLTVQQYGS